VADRNRGGRPVDDDDSLEEPELDDDYADELEDESDEDDLDDELDDDERPAKRSSSRGVRTRTAARVRTKEKDDAGPGILGKFVRYIREIIAELQKVIWPTRKELLTYTTVVIVFVTIMMTIVALLDVGFARLMFLVFGNKTTSQ